MSSVPKQNWTEYLTIHQAAEVLGVSSWTLRNWDKSGKLKPARHPMNGYRIYRHEELEAILESDILPAGTHVTHFAPPIEWAEIARSGHFVQFYESHAALVNSVSEFIAMALEKGEGGLVVATEMHRRGIEKRLNDQGIDVAAAMKRGQYICLDAAKTLSQFMIGTMPDAERFNSVVGEKIAQMAQKYSHLHAFGEMVALLWEEDNRKAAIRLEELWNDLGKTHSFSLFCAYQIKAFAEVNDNKDFNSVCGCHAAIIPAENYSVLTTAGDRLQEISQLQQKAYSLEAEIEHRKEVENSLMKRERDLALLAAVVESSQDAILSKTLEGRILSWNRSAERLFGYKAEEIIGQSILLIIPPERQEEERFIIDRLKRGERIEHYETVRMRKNGERIDISLTISPVRDNHGTIIGASKIARDITERKRIEKELQEAMEKAHAANLAKTEFLANISHEIRTPMNAVIGLSNILAMSQPLTPRQREFIKTLQLSADSLLSLINDLLDISKIEARTIELENIPFCLTRLTQEVISMMSVRLKEKDLTLTTDAEYVKNHMFMGDPTRLRQIILNLCSNAVKFTEQGGIHISITCEATENPDSETVCIAVRDTGIGIAPDKQKDIFEKFVQADNSISRKYGGTGLGLSITKMLLEIMGGTIGVESAPGAGSTFTVRLPLHVARDMQAETLAPEVARIGAADHALSQPRVLLVEDYAANILVATTFLEHFGYAYDLAKDGFEAVEKAKTGNYMAVLMDVQMYGMNGFDATRLIREHEKQSGKPPTLIIGMTAHALAGDRERCLATGMDDYISKPFNHETLSKKLAVARELVHEI